MCKLIAELLGSDLDIVKETIRRLEARSGNSGVDVHLTSDIYVRANMKLKELGLDPKDTTAHELYEALLNLVRLHDSFLRKQFGVSDGSDNNELFKKVVLTLNRMNLAKTAWVLKPAVIKKLLADLPPKTLQKMLGYRSVDSMLKREPANVLLAACRYTEPLTWQQKLKTKYKQLTAMDFEPREIEIRFLGDKRWENIAASLNHKAGGNIVTSFEAGSVSVLPIASQPRPGLTILISALVLEAICEIRVYSTFLKFHQMVPNVGGFIVDVMYHGKGYHIEIAGQKASWKVVHRYYGKPDTKKHPSIFQPHVQPEDLAYKKAEAVLARVEPALYFWDGLDFVGLPKTDGPISFNLIDNVINLVNDLPFEERMNKHLSYSVWDELYMRYLGQESVEQSLLEMLDEKITQTADNFPNMEFVS